MGFSGREDEEEGAFILSKVGRCNWREINGIEEGKE
jgi:hypothetical protein